MPLRPQTSWSELLRSLYGRATYWLFYLLFALGVVLLLASLSCCKTLLSTADKVVLFVGLLTGAVVLWQGQLLNRQLAYGTVLDLYKEWNSESMLAVRRSAWNMETEVPNPDTIEGVLEFLEKVSTLERDRYITRRLVWDSFGWYVGRYFFYCKEEIERLRTKWTHRYDSTLYQDLEAFYGRLLEFEARQRKLKQHEIEESIKGRGKCLSYRRSDRCYVMALEIPVVRVELRPSGIHQGGVGVFGIKGMRKGQKVADGVAEEDFRTLVPWEEFPRLDEDLQRKVMAFCIGTPDGFVPPPEFDFNKLSIEWYLNHSCQGNCGFDENGDFIAIRDIQKNEELSYDYALIESNPNFSMPCACGSRTCRHVVTGNDWKDEKFFLKHRDYMHPHLRRLLPIPA